MALHDAAIIAYAETKIVPVSDRDIWQLGADILEQLLDRSGYEKGEIDGLILSASLTGAGNPFWSQATADALSLELDFCQTVDIGGCSPLGAVARASAAIDAGFATSVLCLYADTAVAEGSARARSFGQEWTTPLGYIGPPAAFGLLTRYYEEKFTLDHRALGKLAVTQREHAILNDLACEKLRKPITIEDYLQSRMINDPVRLLDSVMPCDGASGLLVTGRRAAEKRGLTRCVVPVGYGERTNYQASRALVDPTETGHSAAGARCFAQAGLTPRDIAAFHPYDDFIIAIMMQLEMLGFCPHGQGSAFIRETDFGFAGDLPLNTGGGQISAGQAGLAGGGTNLVEAVRQLFGEGGARQVTNTRNALVTGIGGIPYGRNWNSSAAMILTPDA
ncbi:acetyl-CoA C-acetyltransferase [Sphingobium sp. SYK-6]|uniref:thiolase family protein n=1 Tax=Sphingobium sp. (strain NBRC 103272 / SYK-6) TaxID=627192 RepID=UPI0002277B11|nr:thiolase family protein [Sphingobium sp. SYK-6]BAK68178.1 acetyl-CoA C-acetyltransferase [Sphingobium sp. SYK-6]